MSNLKGSKGSQVGKRTSHELIRGKVLRNQDIIAYTSTEDLDARDSQVTHAPVVLKQKLVFTSSARANKAALYSYHYVVSIRR